MLQRKQTLHILFAVALCVFCLCMPIGNYGAGLNSAVEYNLFLVNQMTGQKFFSTWPLFAILVASTALGICSIFMYHNRIAQARVCALCMLLLVGWYVVYAVFSNLLGGGNMSFSPSVSGILPAFAIVLYFMARKAILADEKLVRDADRIR